MTDFSDWSPNAATGRTGPPRAAGHPASAAPASAPAASGAGPRPGRPFATVTTHPPEPAVPRTRRWSLRSLGRPRPVPRWAAPFVAAAFIVGSGVGMGMITVSGGSGGISADPLAHRPHVTDEESGVSYGVPVDWAEFPEDAGFHSLPPPFTSGIATPLDADDGASVMVASTTDDGSLQELADEQLQMLIALNMGGDDVETTEADPTWVDGREAAVSTLTLDSPGYAGTSLRSVAFEGDSGRTVVVVSLLTEDADSRYEADMAAVMASIRVI